MERVIRVVALLLSCASGPALFAATPIDFNAQIRPILNQNCTSCHGGVKAAGDISFVYRESATSVGKKSGRPVIVPGDPDNSELIRRITSADADYRMPPADHARPLAPEKVALLREWIRQGAPWQDHWAFVPPKPQRVPRLAGAAAKWARGPVDRFIAARLGREKLLPSPEASRAAWLRRVSFDLIGLPPTPEEVAAFAADKAAGAYERQVDRLLSSAHFGERWASLWLDLARYADTKGYEKDDHRTVWQYRDWVVDAFNRNLPYDRFLVEQLAGDLLPKAGMNEYIATGFHRQTQVNDEGGTDDEEYRLAAVIDRVSTTWQVTNAVTFSCVQCHAHPYDPIRHREFYQFLAFFNDTRDADFTNEHPFLRVPDDRAANDTAWRLRREIERLRHDVVDTGRRLEARREQWRPTPIGAATAKPEALLTVQDGALRAEGTIAMNATYELTVTPPEQVAAAWTALRFEVAPDDPKKATHTPERGFIVTKIEFALVRPDGTTTPIEVGRFFPDTENFTTPTLKTLEPPKPAASTEVAVAEPATVPAPGAALASTAAPAEAPKPKPPPPETRDITLDFHFAANPTLSRARWLVASLREPLHAPAGSSLRITISHGRGITEKPAPVRRLRIETSTDGGWRVAANDAELAAKSARVTAALHELTQMPGTNLPIMAELPAGERRETRLFVRGNFLEKTGEPLTPGVPALFPKLRTKGKPDRLAMAEWFFQPGQPLTSRVAVNRFWEQLFGNGLVSTLEDFGSVGEPPSHSELLDWLALHFERELRWDMKALLRELVLSATYRQDARITPELHARDPQNRLLARGPRQRLTAEMVRDQALAASGLLSRKLGGPPVMPPQPARVWQTVYNSKDWVNATGEDRYRRALYTFWKRSAAYPAFLTFDMPARDLCTARRTTTNTPLQALVTLNDEAYHEAAAALAADVLREIGGDARTSTWIARAFERVISRPPTATELARLQRLYDEVLEAPSEATTAAAFAADPAAARHRALHQVSVAILNVDAAFLR